MDKSLWINLQLFQIYFILFTALMNMIQVVYNTVLGIIVFNDERKYIVKKNSNQIYDKVEAESKQKLKGNLEERVISIDQINHPIDKKITPDNYKISQVDKIGNDEKIRKRNSIRIKEPSNLEKNVVVPKIDFDSKKKEIQNSDKLVDKQVNIVVGNKPKIKKTVKYEEKFI